jgi:hypothetical protein
MYFYYDDVQKTFPKVTTDQELLEMFSKHDHGKVVCMTITYTKPNDIVHIPECYTHENSEVLDVPSHSTEPTANQPTKPRSIRCTEPLTSQPTEPTRSHPTDPITSQPTEPTTSQTSTDDDDDEYLKNPQPHNEHVGVDEEGLYIAAPDKEISEDSESDYNSDEEYEEEDGLVGKDPLPPLAIVSYDKEDPPMSVGSIYSNMQEFKLALAQHAIKHEFEYNTEKSDPGRVRAYCRRKNDEGCRWRLHASRMKDNVTIKVTYVLLSFFLLLFYF